MICRILPHIVDDGPANMALDEALLEAVSDDPSVAVLRTYEWTRPTLSLGYFQQIRDAEADPRLAGASWVRRPTGGGAIWHEHELTYALVLPRAHPAGVHATDFYRTVHRAIAAVLRASGVEVAAYTSPDPAAQVRRKRGERPFLCFADRDPEDLIVEGAKVVGSAQRRKPRATLQHGSILLARAGATPGLPGLLELTGRCLGGPGLPAEIRGRLVVELGLDARDDQVAPSERERAAMLRRSVYSTEAWLRKR